MADGKKRPPFDLSPRAEKIFDDYYFCGHQMVGFHILKTEEGLVLFDAMDKPGVDKEFLIPGLKALGLENEKIQMIFLTHGHFDHYVGAEEVRLRTGCQVAMTREDTGYMMWSHENTGKHIAQVFPHITKLVDYGDQLTFGSYTIDVVEGNGHTPGCTNYSFSVHENGEEHRVFMMGGYGIFGPGNYPDGPYPYSRQWAIKQAYAFAASCGTAWEYVKEKGCDIYINPHPHLCDFFRHVEENKKRGEGDANAFVIGVEGVRTWILERYEASLALAASFTDIREEYTGVKEEYPQTLWTWVK